MGRAARAPLRLTDRLGKHALGRTMVVSEVVDLFLGIGPGLFLGRSGPGESIEQFATSLSDVVEGRSGDRTCAHSFLGIRRQVAVGLLGHGGRLRL